MVDYAESKNEFESLFFDPNFSPEETILLEEKPMGFVENKDGKLSDIKLITYLQNEINISVDTDVNKLLFLSDTYYPGWKAFVDGKEVKIYRADYSFRAIVVPQGHHLVKFSYDPLSFRVGYAISLLSFCLLVIVLITVKKTPYNI